LKWKQKQATQEDYKGIANVLRDKIKKVKTQIKLKLTSLK